MKNSVHYVSELAPLCFFKKLRDYKEREMKQNHPQNFWLSMGQPSKKINLPPAILTCVGQLPISNTVYG